MLQDYSGEKLRSLRKRARLTQRQVAKLAKVSAAAVGYLEHGERKPQSGTLEKLLNLYAMRIQYIKNRETIFQETPNGRNLDS